MKRCTESFTIWRDGAPFAFVAGQLVDDKHPILKTHKHLFADPTPTAPSAPPAMRARPAEQATAEPGEARALTPPQQTAGQEDEGGEFDPSGHTGPEVIEYLKTADEDERARVLAAEKAGKGRSTVLGADLPKA
ncbi:hypothetical protein ACIGCZ_00690 [Streptomyces nigra]|uniref:hypothetical protein n=1 Tax=Streptomyces nigra TaxID=1827580 RepID=UPI0037D8AD04